MLNRPADDRRRRRTRRTRSTSGALRRPRAVFAPRRSHERRAEAMQVQRREQHPEADARAASDGRRTPPRRSTNTQIERVDQHDDLRAKQLVADQRAARQRRRKQKRHLGLRERERGVVRAEHPRAHQRDDEQQRDDRLGRPAEKDRRDAVARSAEAEKPPDVEAGDDQRGGIPRAARARSCETNRFRPLVQAR